METNVVLVVEMVHAMHGVCEKENGQSMVQALHFCADHRVKSSLTVRRAVGVVFAAGIIADVELRSVGAEGARRADLVARAAGRGLLGLPDDLIPEAASERKVVRPRKKELRNSSPHFVRKREKLTCRCT